MIGALTAAETRRFMGKAEEGPTGAAWAEAHTLTDAAIVAWNLMGGAVRWEAFESIAEMLGVDDVELLVRNVIAIRDRMAQPGA
jgi:hypothetical protein